MKILKNNILMLENKKLDQLNALCGAKYYFRDWYMKILHANKKGVLSILMCLSIDLFFNNIYSQIYNECNNICISHYVYMALFDKLKSLDNTLFNDRKGDETTGRIFLAEISNEVVGHSFSRIREREYFLEFKILVPQSNGKINAKKAERLIVHDVPKAINQALGDIKSEKYQCWLFSAMQLFEEQEYIRSYLEQNNCIAFIGNGSLLANYSEVLDKENESIIPFKSPLEFQHTFEINDKKISGMIITKGITVVTGVSYSGKSTFFNALVRGIYNHILDSGLEYVITNSQAVEIASEVGRKINYTDMSLFYQGNTSFVSQKASGCTSEAANVIEAIQAGAKILLFDEDVSAANFLYRDSFITKIVNESYFKSYYDVARFLLKEYSISTVIVTGSNSAWLDVADKVIIFCNYEAYERKTFISNSIQNEISNDIKIDYNSKYVLDSDGMLLFDYGKLKINFNVMGDMITEEDNIINLINFSTIVSPYQKKAIIIFIDWLCNHNYSNPISFLDLVHEFLEKDIVITKRFNKNREFADEPNKYDLIKILNRLNIIARYIVTQNMVLKDR